MRTRSFPWSSSALLKIYVIKGTPKRSTTPGGLPGRAAYTRFTQTGRALRSEQGDDDKYRKTMEAERSSA